MYRSSRLPLDIKVLKLGYQIFLELLVGSCHRSTDLDLPSLLAERPAELPQWHLLTGVVNLKDPPAQPKLTILLLDNDGGALVTALDGGLVLHRGEAPVAEGVAADGGVAGVVVEVLDARLDPLPLGGARLGEGEQEAGLVVLVGVGQGEGDGYRDEAFNGAGGVSARGSCGSFSI